MLTTFLRRVVRPVCVRMALCAWALPLLAAPAKVAITVTPTTATLAPGGSKSFTATVSGTTNTAVTWTFTGGSVAGSGNTVTYSAPSTTGIYTLTAASVADTTKKATATVTVSGPVAFPSITLTPAFAMLGIGQAQAFTAKVTGLTNTSVGWRAANGSISRGTLTSTGTYVAGSYTSSYGEIPYDVLECYSLTDPSVVTRAVVGVIPVNAAGAVAVIVTPPTKLEFVEGELGSFQATATGATDARVEWESATGSNTGANDDGIISVLGAFTAKNPSTSTWGLDQSRWVLLRAVSVADRTKWAYLMVRVWRKGAVVLNPGGYSETSPRVLAGGKLQIAAEVKGGGSVIWSLQSSGGSVSTTGLYTAPSTLSAGTIATVRATNATDPTIYQDVQIPLAEPGDVFVTSNKKGLLPGGSATFTATTLNTTDGVVWSVATSNGSPAGSITRNGAYTAPPSLDFRELTRDIYVTATNAKKPLKSGTALLKVEAPLEAGAFAVTATSWPDTVWSATYDASGYAQGGYDRSRDPRSFWTITGNGVIVNAWWDFTHGYPCLAFKTGVGAGPITLTALPANDVSSLSVQKTIQVVLPPDLGAVYSNGTGTLKVLDFGTKTILRPDGQSALMHRLWTAWGTSTLPRWTGRKLLGPGIATIYSGYDAWSDVPVDANFALDGLTLADPAYKRISQVIIGVEPATTVVDGSPGTGPSIAYLKVGQTLQLQAAVGGTTDKVVTWACPTGNGTVSTTGLYTAPASPGTYTVTATAHAAPNPTYTLKIRVGTLDNAPADKLAGVFTGTATTLSSGVTGQGRIDLFANGTDLVSEIDDPDPYTANFHSSVIGGVRGCSAYFNDGTRAVFDPQPDGTFLPVVEYARQGGARVALENATRSNLTSVEIMPRFNFVTDPAILTGSTRTFTAQVVSTTNTAVVWDAYPYNTNLSVAGNTMVFTAPPVPAGSPYLDITLRATSNADSTKFDSMILRIKPVPVTAVTPATATVTAGPPVTNTKFFTATFPTQPSNDAFWSIQEGAVGGSINSAGLYSPGTTVGTFHLVATSQWDATLKALATVTVVEGDPFAAVTVTPTTINAGQSVTLSWTDVWALNTPNPRLTLSIEDTVTHTFQTIDVTGRTSYVFSPVHTSMGTLIITSASGKTGERSSGWMNVRSNATIQSFTANPASIRYGDPVTLTAVFTGTNGKLLQYIGGYGTVYGPITSGVPVQIPAGSSVLLNAQPKFSVRCEDAYGNVIDGNILTVPCTPAIMNLTATPAGILTGSGGSSTLAWGINSAGLAATVTLKATLVSTGVQTTTAMGSATSKVVTPTESTDYTLTVSTNAGGESKIIRVRVAEVAALSLSPTTVSLAPGATTSFTATLIAIPTKNGLSWTTTGGTLTGSGTTVTYQAPPEVGTYTVTVASVADPSLTATATITVLIGGPGGGGGGGGSSTFDIRSFTAGSSASGPDHRLLSWSTIGATGLSLRDSNGIDLDVTGTTSMDVVPSGTTIYTLTATDGKSFLSRTLTVEGAGFAIAIAPTKVTMFTGATFTFSYSIYAPSNRVTWTCDGGTIAADGTFTAPPGPGTYTVTATLVDDTTKSSSASVTVNEISLQIDPGYLTMTAGQTFGFGYQTFTSADDVPTWSATAGSILANGLFTAPITPGLVTISLTSSKDTTKVATATVEVKAIDVMVFPSSLQLLPQGQYQLSAGTSRGGVTWSVVEANGGSISTTGLYTAPNEVGTFTIKARSALDSTRFGTAQVIVATTGGGEWGPGGGGGGGTSSPVNNGVSVDPPMQTVDAGTYAVLNATVLASQDQGVNWTIQGNDARAKVDEQGVFTAHEPAIYTVVATSKLDSAVNGTAIIEVKSSVHGLANPPAGLNLEAYSLTVLTNGKVLIAGGQDTRVIDTDANKGYRGTAYLYDPDAKTFTPTGEMLQARAGHQATLLSDGRVLIAGGRGYFSWPGTPNDPITERPVKWGEIYNPTTNVFEALPVPPDHSTYPAGSMRTAHGIRGQVARLANGQVFMAGMAYAAPSGSDSFDVFDPTTNLFDLTDIQAANTNGTQVNTDAFRTREGGAVVTLDDGRVLVTGGSMDYGVNDAKPCTINTCALSEARVFDPQTPLTLSPASTMIQARFGHTMTKLPNGKILILGGADHFIEPEAFLYLPVPSATAEIFDPENGTFTPSGSMKWPRAEHAAILLPTGQVMVMGGYTSASGDGTGTIWNYPTETEIYDPEAGTFSVMDKLAFGLDRPKLALMKDGGVFVAGKPIITASAGTPAAGIQEKGSKSVRSVIAPQTLPGSGWLQEAVFGTVAPSNFNIQAYPEDAALYKDPMTGNIIADLYGMRPRTTRISIPRPGNANNRHRFFVMKVRKPSKYHSITGARVLLTAGGQSQFVLGQQEGPNGQAVAPGLFERIYTASDIPYTETITEERSQELKRKNWLVNWLPSQASTDELTEYYRVRVTMDTANPSAIHYGFENGVPSPQAPSKTLAYHFRIFYQQPILAVGDGFSDMPTYACPTTIEPHWDTSQYWTNFWYSNAPNGDRWVDFDTYNWIANDTKRNTLMPTNDFTLEHGRNTGHPHSHLNGRQGDLYHPGYTVFTSNAAGTGGGGFRDTYLLPTMRNARGWVEKDAAGTVTRTVAPDPAAVRTLARWILAARAGIQNIMAADVIGGFGAESFLYLSTDTVSAPGAITVDCMQLRKLMIDGACPGLYADYTNGTRTDWGPLDLTNNPALQPAERPQRWKIDESQWHGDTTATHTTHFHLQWSWKAKPFLIP